MTGKRQACLAGLVAVLVLGAVSGPVFSQDTGAAAPAAGAAPAPGQTTLAQKWKDFIHYINIAQGDMARSFGQAILESQAEPREIYILSDKTTDIEKVLSRGAQLPGMAPIIKRIRKMIRDGFQAEAANPDVIARAIELLAGTLNQYDRAKNLLRISGEYALPQLLQKLHATDTSDVLRERIVVVLPHLGLVAVRGMSIALQTDNPAVQEALANALRKIGYPLAAPRLKELTERKGVLPRVRSAAIAALVACAGQDAQRKKLSQLYFELADKYYHRAESLRPDARYDKANVWTWSPKSGLSFTPVPRPIFCDIYAMRMARLALKNDNDLSKALVLWLAAGFKRQGDLPEGASDPLKGNNDAKYYALAAGPRFLLNVLETGLNEDDAPVSLGAIEALAQTGGAESLVQEIEGGVQPLVKALSFPDRHVRFLAATALADSLPTKKFDGSAFVISVLNEALRQKGKKTAVLITGGSRANELKDAILAAGYEVIVNADSAKALADGRKGSGVDMVVLTRKPEPGAILTGMRKDPFYKSVPTVILLQGADLRRQAKEDKRTVLLPVGANAAAVGEAMAKALALGIGKPLTSEEADAWTIRVSATVRMLGLTNSRVHDVSRVLMSLKENTLSENPAVQISAADALAVVDLSAAQQALAQLGCSKATNPVRLKAFSALSESLRRFGNKIPAAESRAIVEVVNGAEPLDIRRAAAKAQGAQNLSSDRVKSMVLKRQ